MRRLIAACYVLFALFPQLGLAATPADQVAKWQEGKRMQVVFKTGEKTIGRLGPTSPDGFILNPDKKGRAAPRTIAFSEVRSVQSKWTTGEKWLAAGLIYAGFTVFFAVTLGY